MEKLNLTALKKVKGFVDNAAVKTEVKFEIDGVEHEFEVYCRKFRFDTFTNLNASENASVNMVLKGIVDENGKDLFTYEQACSLHPNLATALIRAVTDVNTFKKKN